MSILTALLVSLVSSWLVDGHLVFNLTQDRELEMQYKELRRRSSLSSRSDQIIDTYLEYSSQFGYQEESFFLNMVIGNPGQSLRLVVETTPNTWVPSPFNYTERCPPVNQTHAQCWVLNYTHTFEPTESSTFRNYSGPANLTSALITEGAVNIQGYYGIDDWTFGQTTIPNVTFGVGHAVTDHYNQPTIGLLPRDRYQNSSANVESFSEALLRAGVIERMVYGLYLNDVRSPNSAQLSMGSVDTTKYEGDLHMVTSSTDYMVDLRKVTVNVPDSPEKSKVIKDTANNTAADTALVLGVNYMEVPQPVLDYLVDLFDAETLQGKNVYFCDCSWAQSNVTLDFSFPGVDIKMPASQLILETTDFRGDPMILKSGKRGCHLAVNAPPIAQTFSWLLGNPFLRSAYVVWDFSNHQTSIAPVRYNVTEQNMVLVRDSVTKVQPKSVQGSNLDSGVVKKSGPSESAKIGAVAGGILGLVIIIGLLAVAQICYLRRRRRKQEEFRKLSEASVNAPIVYTFEHHRTYPEPLHPGQAAYPHPAFLSEPQELDSQEKRAELGAVAFVDTQSVRSTMRSIFAVCNRSRSSTRLPETGAAERSGTSRTASSESIARDANSSDANPPSIETSTDVPVLSPVSPSEDDNKRRADSVTSQNGVAADEANLKAEDTLCP